MKSVDEETVMRILKCGRDQYPRLLQEQFPHVLDKIVALWNSQNFGTYVTDLLQTNGSSGGRMDRDGFPKSTRQEILKLAELHKKTFGR